LKKYIINGIFLTIIFFFIFISLVPSIDNYSLDNPLWNGLSNLAEKYKLEYISISDLTQFSYNNTIVFLIGPNEPIKDQDSEILKKFVNNGGILILMDEYGFINKTLIYMETNATIVNYPLLDPLYKFKSSQFPKVEISIGERKLKVYLNYASILIYGKGLPIGFSSYFSYLDKNINNIHDFNEPYGSMCIAAVYNIGKGKLIVFSDSDIFINSMINLGENSDLAKYLINNSKAYLIKDYLSFSYYTTIRKSFISFLAFLSMLFFNSSFNYISIFLLSIICFYSFKEIYKKAIKKFYKLIKKEDKVYKVINKHPTWDKEILLKLASEVYIEDEHS